MDGEDGRRLVVRGDATRAIEPGGNLAAVEGREGDQLWLDERIGRQAAEHAVGETAHTRRRIRADRAEGDDVDLGWRGGGVDAQGECSAVGGEAELLDDAERQADH